jgi:hypothetical protein
MKILLMLIGRGAGCSAFILSRMTEREHARSQYSSLPEIRLLL